MRKTIIIIITALLSTATLLSAAESTDGKIVLRLMGDSTMADKDLSKQNPERGWGQRLPSHLDTNVVVVNYAQNGRSTKSFITLGLWDKVVGDLSEGEYLFIEFGHNDAKESDTTRYAPAFGLYKENLTKFAEYALSVGAKPIIFSPVSRRKFDDGQLDLNCHTDYPAAAKQVADSLGIPFVDALSITQEWLTGLGDEASREYYMWVAPGTNPRHPDGLEDNTHTNGKGARKLVELLLPAIVEVIPELADHVVEYDYTVAQNGSGDFFTVQEAIDAAPDYIKEGGVSIHIRPGVYNEKVTIPANKERIHLIGDDPATTIISWDDYAKKIGPTGVELGTSATSTVFLYGDDFLAENITVENTAGEGPTIGQACAITVDADRAAFLNCRFIANQDTIYTYGEGEHQYFGNCWIEGTTDFIFGYSTVWFDKCTILSKKNSYITAASTVEGQEHGYVFHKCRLIAAEGIDSVYLGRPWRPYAQTVFINCEMDGHIMKEGWHNWNKKYAEKTAFYAEYGSTGEGAASVKERVKWSHQLTEADLKPYTPKQVLDAGSVIDKTGASVKVEWYYQNIIDDSRQR